MFLRRTLKRLDNIAGNAHVFKLLQGLYFWLAVGFCAVMIFLLLVGEVTSMGFAMVGLGVCVAAYYLNGHFWASQKRINDDAEQATSTTSTSTTTSI